MQDRLKIESYGVNICSILKPVQMFTRKQKEKYFIKINREINRYIVKSQDSNSIIKLPSKIRDLASTEVNEISRDDYNKIIRNLKYIRFEKSDIHNWGVFTCRKIFKDEAIVEYIGEIISYSVTQSREQYYEQHGNKGSYIFQLTQDMFLDATKRGGIARYLNHSCDPNCDTQVVNVDDLYHIIIFAKRDIEPFEELTYDYGLPFEKKENAVKCLCRSKNCRGYLNYPSEGSKEEEEFLKIQALVAREKGAASRL